MTFRRIGAVFAGFVVIFILSIGTDMLLHPTGVFPPFGQPMSDALFALATVDRIVYGITARLAPDRPMQHALVLGLMGVIVSIAGAVAVWGKEPEFGPKWYALAITRLRCLRVSGRQAPRDAGAVVLANGWARPKRQRACIVIRISGSGLLHD
jgi:hypothetical protein